MRNTRISGKIRPPRVARRWWGAGAGVAVAALSAGWAGTATLAPEPLAAQEARGECRCVDAEGREIENCTCFRAWTSPDRAFSLSAVKRPRARIGVSIGPDEGPGEDGRGVRILAVTPGSPADEAGLREGDVMTAVDGRSVLEPMEDEPEGVEAVRWVPFRSGAVHRFTRIVGELDPGEPVEITYLRNGETRTATVVPEEIEGAFFGNAFHFEPSAGGSRVFSLGDGEGEGFRMLARSFDPCVSRGGGDGLVLVAGDRCVDGLRLQTLNPQLAEYFGVETGVLVLEVLEDAALGLTAGDVIVAIGDRAVEDAADVRRILGSYEPDEPVTLTAVRKGDRVQVRGTRRSP